MHPGDPLRPRSIVARSNAIDRFVRRVRHISTVCGFVAAALIATGVVVVCEMVFVRYVLNMNTIWQTDFVTYCLIAATFVGSPFVLMTRGHAVLTFTFWKEAWDNTWVSDTMWRARLWIPYAAMPIGLGLLTLQSIADLLALLTGREPPFGITKERTA
jgi:TRAP-type C4-dicarboxylate transport system permease small subunit